MILVTLGTQDKKFYRLLDAIQKQIDNKIITDEVIVQAGNSCDYKSKNMKIFDLVSSDDLEKLVKKSNLLITHGGVGSIIMGLKHNKKIIAVARLKEYKEHVNNHQLQIVESLSNKGYILGVKNLDDLGSLIKNSKDFKPLKYKSNIKNIQRIVKQKINELL